MCTQIIQSTYSIPIIMGTGSSYPAKGIKAIDDRKILGIVIRCQSESTKFDKNGTELVSSATINKAHLKVKKGSQTIHDCIPLDLLVHDEKSNAPGDYASIMIPKGLDDSDITIHIPGSVIAADQGKSIELIFIVSPPPGCDL